MQTLLMWSFIELCAATRYHVRSYKAIGTGWTAPLIESSRLPGHISLHGQLTSRLEHCLKKISSNE